MTHILRVDASMNRQNSTSRMLADALVEKLAESKPVSVTLRDLVEGVPFIGEAWIDANFTDPADRSPAQRTALASSDVLVQELKAADILIMSVPIYNFGPPAAFKAWIDQIARARETFRYSAGGPVGLLEIAQAYLIVTSGGTRIGSEMDFVTGYTTMLFRFLGINDMQVIPCAGVMTEGEDTVAQALAKIRLL
ncbi:MAG: NAD(P)H-dependent oxidoreductase [Pseudomonadales bacterium]|nr:NAD(P)H-dependent oxidoreductase [Pseudomonadales bacterium]